MLISESSWAASSTGSAQASGGQLDDQETRDGDHVGSAALRHAARRADQLHRRRLQRAHALPQPRKVALAAAPQQPPAALRIAGCLRAMNLNLLAAKGEAMLLCLSWTQRQRAAMVAEQKS